MDSNVESMLKSDESKELVRYCDECYTEVFSKCSSDQIFEKLPIEVVEKIFEFLPLKELAQMSLTCHRLQDAARKHFELKRQCGEVRIDTRCRHPQVYFKKEIDSYKIRFRNLIPHVRLTLRSGVHPADAFKFIKDNCYKHLKTLDMHFDGERKIIVNINEADLFTDQLKSLECLGLHSRFWIQSLCHIFPNVRALNVDCMEPDYQTTFFSQTFSKLRTLSLCNIECKQSEELEHFLQNNVPQLENIHCNNAETIRYVLSNKTKQSNAVLEFIGDNRLKHSLDQLAECSRRKIINSVHIVDGYEITRTTTQQRLARMENVKHLHLTGLRLPKNMDSMPYVRSLCLQHCSDLIMILDNQQKFTELVKGFPNLEELRLYVKPQSLRSIEEIISFIIDGLPKLKYLYYAGTFGRVFNENIQKWDAIRSKLENVPHLTIHFGFCESHSTKIFKANSISVQIVNYEDSLCYRGKLKKLTYIGYMHILNWHQYINTLTIFL